MITIILFAAQARRTEPLLNLEKNDMILVSSLYVRRKRHGLRCFTQTLSCAETRDERYWEVDPQPADIIGGEIGEDPSATRGLSQV
jgi:hypothetical protein